MHKSIPQNITEDDYFVKDKKVWQRLLKENKKVAIWLDIKNDAMTKFFEILED